MASGRKPGCARVGEGINVLAKNNRDPARFWLGPGAAPVGRGRRASADLPLPGGAALPARFPRTVPGPARTSGPASHPCHSAPVQGSSADKGVPCPLRQLLRGPGASLTVIETFYFYLCRALLIFVPGYHSLSPENREQPLDNHEAAPKLPKVRRKQLVISYSADKNTDHFISCTHGK